MFYEQQSGDDFLWHGQRPGPQELLSEAGADRWLSKKELPRFLASQQAKKTFAVPTLDPVTNLELQALLGRSVGRDGPDSTLRDVIIEMRLDHDDFSLSEINKACALTAEAFAAGARAVRPNENERSVRAAMESTVRRAGCGQAFSPIVTVRGEVLHQQQCGRQMHDGDLLLVDFGAESAEGYASDVTRCYPVGGAFSSLQRDVYQLVLHAHKTVLALMRPGLEFAELHQLACETLSEGLIQLGMLRGSAPELVQRGAHALFFPHGLGHLLGLDVHDMEEFGDAAGYGPGRARSQQFGLSLLRLDRKLSRGMIVTVEPGLYWLEALLQDSSRTNPFADCIDLAKADALRAVRGLRIEDTVHITDDGVDVLTAGISKEIPEIEELLNA